MIPIKLYGIVRRLQWNDVIFKLSVENDMP